MYKVFINGNVLFISRMPLKDYKGFKKVINTEFKGEDKFLEIITLMEKKHEHKLCYCVFGDDIVYMWKRFRRHYKLILAGGGLVRNSQDKILFIFRNGRWDLPKGKGEKGEVIEETALREVKEECGMENLIIADHIMETYHTYGGTETRKLKKTYWFRMYSDDKDLVPQEEEGITKIKWLKEEKLEKIYENTFPSIIDVINKDINLKKVGSSKEWDHNMNFE